MNKIPTQHKYFHSLLNVHVYITYYVIEISVFSLHTNEIKFSG